MKGYKRALERAPLGTEMFVKRLRYPVNAIVTVAAAGAGVGFGNATIAAMPQGNLVFLQLGGYLNFATTDTDLIATWAGNFAVGTTADADGSFAGTEANLIPSSAIAAAVARVSNGNRGFTNTGADGSLTALTPFLINNTNNAMNMILNVNVNAADITDAQSAPLTVTGYLDLVAMVMGDD